MRIDFIVNPILFTTAAGEGFTLARESRADVVVAVGGDGTVSEVARGVLGSDKILGIIPCGSGDGLALHLGISRLPMLAVKALNEGSVTGIDVACMNGDPFFCTAGFGLDARVSMEFARSTRRGLPRYIELAWEQWLKKDLEQYTISGADVPMATIVKPMMNSLIPNFLAMPEAPFTIASAPRSMSARPARSINIS